MGKFLAVVLAAGKGKRTRLPYSKVLLPLCGKPMVAWVVDALAALNPDEIVVVASPDNREKISGALGAKARIALQPEPLGTGHALKCALGESGAASGTLLVACGDAPLLDEEIFRRLLDLHREKKSAATVLTAKLPDPSGYGRIVRSKQGQVLKIVEEKDADAKTKKISEINSGTYCFQLEELAKAIPNLTRNNSQNEYYLTDAVAWFAKNRKKVLPFLIEDYQAALGVNTLKELSEAHDVLNGRLKEKWLAEGVIFTDYDSVQLHHDVAIGAGTTIHPYTILENGTRIGARCSVGPFTRMASSTIGDDCAVQNSVCVSASAGNGCSIGPYAYLRPGTKLDDDVKVGDFVEIKNSTIGHQSKVPHLSYVGDATVGKSVNIGAGVITCNYDGKGKHQTVIEDGAFIGSNTNLVAPVRVGNNAVTGAGAVVKKDVEPGSVVAGVPAKLIRKREVV